MFVTNFFKKILSVAIVALYMTPAIAQDSSSFAWPEGKTMALSISFDDGWPSQIDKGVPVLDKYGVKATFYVLPDRLGERLSGWKQAVTSGHEIGNHSLHHPCSENFNWVKSENAIENYTLDRMKAELIESNKKIEETLKVTPVSFAYPCGRTTLGRGKDNKSYIPVVDELFQSGRGWLDETANNPGKMDMTQVTGIKIDNMDFEEILPILEEAKRTGSWVVLAGHEVGNEGAYTTRASTLEKLLTYVSNPENGIWVSTVGTVSHYVLLNREH